MMTQDASKFLARSRAFWQPCLAFLVLGAVPALLAGCSDMTSPLDADADGALGSKGFQSTEEQLVQTGDATLAVTAPQYGRWQLDGNAETVIINAMPGVPVQFYWQAVDAKPLGNVLSYRYGWDVANPDDPNDPGWYGPPRSGYKSQQTQPMEIWDGAHALTIECWDGLRLLVRVVVEVRGMPVEPRVVVRETSTDPR